MQDLASRDGTVAGKLGLVKRELTDCCLLASVRTVGGHYSVLKSTTRRRWPRTGGGNNAVNLTYQRRMRDTVRHTHFHSPSNSVSRRPYSQSCSCNSAFPICATGEGRPPRCACARFQQGDSPPNPASSVRNIVHLLRSRKIRSSSERPLHVLLTPYR